MWQSIILTNVQCTRTCKDENPDYTRETHTNLYGALFYFVEAVYGSPSWKPFIGGKELTYAVCTR